METELTSENIAKRIIIIRGEKVMLDSDLAGLYGVSTGRFNEQVKRNLRRFPHDFMFQLTVEEADFLRSQFAISNVGRGGRRYLPYVFTEMGVAMLSSVLNSERAILVNIEIMRVFTRLRNILASHRELAQKLIQLEKRYDSQFKIVFDAIRQLMTPPPAKSKPIGFLAEIGGQKS